MAAILGLCRENTYDGQAAIELGELALTAIIPEQALINDGGLALGQAVTAYWRWQMHVSGNTR